MKHPAGDVRWYRRGRFAQEVRIGGASCSVLASRRNTSGISKDVFSRAGLDFTLLESLDATDDLASQAAAMSESGGSCSDSRSNSTRRDRSAGASARPRSASSATMSAMVRCRVSADDVGTGHRRGRGEGQVRDAHDRAGHQHHSPSLPARRVCGESERVGLASLPACHQ